LYSDAWTILSVEVRFPAEIFHSSATSGLTQPISPLGIGSILFPDRTYLLGPSLIRKGDFFF
jgi:hypothetical protein